MSTGSIALLFRSRRMLCGRHSTVTDRHAVCTQDAIQPTAVGACAAEDDAAGQAIKRQQGS